MLIFQHSITTALFSALYWEPTVILFKMKLLFCSENKLLLFQTTTRFINYTDVNVGSRIQLMQGL